MVHAIKRMAEGGGGLNMLRNDIFLLKGRLADYTSFIFVRKQFVRGFS